MSTSSSGLRRMTRMEREVTRHTVTSVVATIGSQAVIWLVIAFSADRAIVTGTSSASVALVFGLYGPVFLLLSAWTFRGLHGPRLRGLLVRTEERSRVVRMFVLVGPKSWAFLVTMAGVVAVVVLAVNDARQTPWLIGVCIVGVAGSWVTMVAVFAIEYMRLWANEDAVAFPGDEERTFRDFVYLAVQLSTTFSSSDVQLVRRSARNLATVHSVLAFAYSTAIIAVLVSLLIANAG
jgi:uncharacterized membrane protein